MVHKIQTNQLDHAYIVNDRRVHIRYNGERRSIRNAQSSDSLHSSIDARPYSYSNEWMNPYTYQKDSRYSSNVANEDYTNPVRTWNVHTPVSDIWDWQPFGVSIEDWDHHGVSNVDNGSHTILGQAQVDHIRGRSCRGA
jgi:hypothetical protein